jgi:hypothetical protein
MTMKFGVSMKRGKSTPEDEKKERVEDKRSGQVSSPASAVEMRS